MTTCLINIIKRGLRSLHRGKEAHLSQDNFHEESKIREEQIYITSTSTCRTKEHKPGFSYNLNYMRFDTSRQNDTDEEQNMHEIAKPYSVRKPKRDHLKNIKKYIEKYYSGIKRNELMSRLSHAHLSNSNFNLILKYHTEFILIIQKHRRNSLHDLELVKELCKLLKMPLPRESIDNEFIATIKERVLQSFLYHINLDNNLYEYK